MKLVLALSLTLLLAVPAHAVLKAGQKAPEFTLTDLHDKPRTLKDFRGRVVVVHFWMSGSKFCAEQAPILSRLYRKFGAKELAIVGISIDRGGWDPVRDFAGKHDLPYVVLLDDKMKAVTRYGFSSVPVNVLIDPKGIVLSVRTGFEHSDALEREVERQVGRHFPPPIPTSSP